MPAINITVPIHIILRLTITVQVSKNVTLPCIQNSSLPTTTEAPVLPSGYVAFAGYGSAYKYFDTKLNYTEARKRCLNENGELAVVDSSEKVKKIISTFGSLQWPWIGIRLHATEGWTTVDGKSGKDLPWVVGQPSIFGECANIWPQFSGLSNSYCYAESDFLCEIAWPRN